MDNKIFAFLGLAQRSGNLISGEDTCEYYIKKNAVHLIIIAGDASENTIKKFRDMAIYRKIRFVIFGNKQTLSHAIGKFNRAVLCIKDKNFAIKIYSLIMEMNDCLNNSGGE